MANFPVKRLRRLRYNPALRNMISETSLTRNDLIYPLFVVPGQKVKKEIRSMPGVFQMSVDVVAEECKEIEDIGIPAVILFGIPDHKDEVGSGAYDPNGIIQQAIRAIKKSTKNLLVITDVCLCEYRSEEHTSELQSHQYLVCRLL